jgi:hypothetical protein
VNSFAQHKAQQGLDADSVRADFTPKKRGFSGANTYVARNERMFRRKLFELNALPTRVIDRPAAQVRIVASAIVMAHRGNCHHDNFLLSGSRAFCPPKIRLNSLVSGARASRPSKNLRARLARSGSGPKTLRDFGPPGG